jgi:hypothetical protein
MRDAVNHHRGDEVSVVSLFSDDSMLNYESFPLGEDCVSIGPGLRKDSLRAANSCSARSTSHPKPLFAKGRVATAQSSIRFCGKIESISPRCRSAISPSRASGWAICPSSMERRRTLVSTAKLTTEHLLFRDKCFRGLSLHLIVVGVQAFRY